MLKNRLFIQSLVGQTFGDLKVIEYLGKPRNGNSLWLCRCTCGKETKYRSQNLTTRKKKGCKYCNFGDIAKNIRMERNLLRIYKNGAKRRNISFSLQDEEFYSLIRMPCYFCGKYRATRNIHTKEKHTNYNGVARLNNSGGYTPENSVPCCTYCNQAKNSRDAEEFLEWIKEIYEFNYKNRKIK